LIKKKILILGQSITAHCIIKSLKDKFNITTCGKKNDDLDFDDKIKNIKINYKNKLKIFYYINKKKFNFLIPDGNDTSYLTSSFIAEKKNFIGFEKFSTTKTIHDKIALTKFLNNNNIPLPRFHIINKNSNLKKINFKFPLFYRPSDQNSGIGVKKISDIKNLKKIISINKKYKNHLFTKFINGKLLSHSILISKKKNIDFFVDEYCKNYKVNFSVSPSIINENSKKKIKTISKKIIQILNLKSGLLHIQYMIKGRNIYFIEACRRCPGDFYGILIKKSYHYDYYKNYANNFLGINLDERIKKKTIKYYRKTIYRSSEINKIKKKYNNIIFYRSYKQKKIKRKIGIAIYN
jgi:carbamoylphosphate synthase large subunit